ncbi:MAG: 1-deoxy-D-xylulose-5-phosphate reductoisomerase, partial [Actinomycetia bacterium]|nr:1-deoxy-D-xylulose-5-phosphate reductoisomerase [Actinomycetes bacterium]
GTDVETLTAQATTYRPSHVVIGDETRLAEVEAGVPAGTEVMAGPTALAEAAEIADVTVNGVVGFAGLPVTLGCLQAGKRLALANKESLIAAGPVVQGVRRTPGAELVPVDSEHAAIHQCLRANDVGERVARIQLTASGGPFRGRSAADLARVSIEDALAHPTWSMGPKITIDSSTLMNKGLEVIEANELFGTPAGVAGFELTFDDIEVVVHPQSIIHSMVTYSDGSTIAQLSHPDMRLPIGYALAYPDRFPVPYGQIDWTKLDRLDFEAPDRVAFPCLDLAFAAGRVGGTAPATLSAANEVAVEAFLAGQIRWVEIAPIIESVLDAHDWGTAGTLEEVLHADEMARTSAARVVTDLAKGTR